MNEKISLFSSIRKSLAKVRNDAIKTDSETKPDTTVTAPPLDTTLLKQRHQHLASALHVLTLPPLSSNSNSENICRRLMVLSDACLQTAAALMQTESENVALKQLLAESETDACLACGGPTEDSRVCDQCLRVSVPRHCHPQLYLLRSAAERLTAAVDAQRDALKHVFIDEPLIDSQAAVDGALAAAVRVAEKVRDADADELSADELASLDDDDMGSDNGDAVFVDQRAHIGTLESGAAWPCFEVAVIDGVYRERDLGVLRKLGRPVSRRDTGRLLASWLDNEAHPYGRSMSLFLAALLHCIAAHRGGATGARVRLADSRRVNPAGQGGNHHCRVCGNRYQNEQDLDRHTMLRHSISAKDAAAAAAARDDAEAARVLLDEAVRATKAFIASTFAGVCRQYPVLPRAALRAALERQVLERVYPHIAALYAHADEQESAALNTRLDALSTLHPAVFDIGAAFWPLLGVQDAPKRNGCLSDADQQRVDDARSRGTSPAPAAVAAENLILERAGEQLHALAGYTSVSGKLTALTAVGGIITQCIDRHFGGAGDHDERVVLGADDLLPLYCYVIVRTRPRALLSQLHAMEAFITCDAVNGKQGYFLVTASMAVDYVATLDQTQLIKEFESRAIAEKIEFADQRNESIENVIETVAASSTTTTLSSSSSSLLSRVSEAVSPRQRLRASIALPSVADDSIHVLRMNLTSGHVESFFDAFDVIGDEDVLLRNTCIYKEHSSLRRGAFFVTTRRLCFLRKSVQFSAEWAQVRSVARRRGGAAFGASIEVHTDDERTHTFSGFQVTIDALIAHIDAVRHAERLLLYCDWSAKLTQTVAGETSTRAVTLRVDESHVTLFCDDRDNKAELHAFPLATLRSWRALESKQLELDVVDRDERVLLSLDRTANDVIYFLHFLTARVAKAKGMPCFMAHMSDVHLESKKEAAAAIEKDEKQENSLFVVEV